MKASKHPGVESRSNALWGRGGKRADALWGRSGRAPLIAAISALTLVIPLAAGAKDGGRGGQDGQRGDNSTYVSQDLLKLSQQDGARMVRVIIQSNQSFGRAESAFRIAEAGPGSNGDHVNKRLSLIDGISVEITASKLAFLQKIPGLTVTPDAPVRASSIGHYSQQMWPYESGAARLWGSYGRPDLNAPAIAVVDSGVEPGRADFGNRLLPQVNLGTRAPNSPGDGRGHGTFVASIAAGDAPGYTGTAPKANILPIDVMDDNGVAYTSDVIAACQWILDNKSTYNIRVANFSLHSGTKAHFYDDPLDRAVEKLWFNGVFVVAAAGNYGVASGPSGVLYAPGNDPFVMTVGAVDLGTSIRAADDKAPAWSAYGYTEDGFAKPEIGAPGRYMIGAVPQNSTLPAQRPDHVVEPGYMELSGTSFAAPVVAGAAAQLIALHPTWSPDAIKGALMLTAKATPASPPLSTGVGEISIPGAAYLTNPPNPNKALAAYVSVSPSGAVTFDAASWSSVVKANASWAAASWSDAAWALASWSTASWSDASWSAASWSDASWATVAISDASWSDASFEDAAEGDAGAPAPPMDAAAFAALESDPLLAVPASVAPPGVTPPPAPSLP